MGVYRRQIKAAEAVGDREALKEWADRKEMVAKSASDLDKHERQRGRRLPLYDGKETGLRPLGGSSYRCSTVSGSDR